MTGSGGEVTVVGQGAKLDGKVVSAGSLRIDGTITGSIEADGDVMLSSSAVVSADLDATNASIAGRLTGNVRVSGKAELLRGGRVDGDITARTLVVEEGAVFNGQSRMEGNTPAKPASEEG